MICNRLLGLEKGEDIFVIESMHKEVSGKDDYGYQPCERAAFKLLFWDDYRILKRREDNDYQGYTRIILMGRGKKYYCKYSWGSCSGCDTLEGSGPVEAIKMIMEEVEDFVEEYGK